MNRKYASLEKVLKHKKGQQGTTRFVVPLLLVICSMASAETSLTRYTIGGGGGIMHNSTKTVAGTIGQPFSGETSGVKYQISGGFWPEVEEPLVDTPTPTVTSTETELPTPTETEIPTPTFTPTPTATEIPLGIPRWWDY
jgi:hypothetical protein